MIIYARLMLRGLLFLLFLSGHNLHHLLTCQNRYWLMVELSLLRLNMTIKMATRRNKKNTMRLIVGNKQLNWNVMPQAVSMWNIVKLSIKTWPIFTCAKALFEEFSATCSHRGNNYPIYRDFCKVNVISTLQVRLKRNKQSII